MLIQIKTNKIINEVRYFFGAQKMIQSIDIYIMFIMQQIFKNNLCLNKVKI